MHYIIFILYQNCLCKRMLNKQTLFAPNSSILFKLYEYLFSSVTAKMKSLRMMKCCTSIHVFDFRCMVEIEVDNVYN